MILLSFVIGYPVFMAFSYFVAKLIFPPIDKVLSVQEEERKNLFIKAKRIKKTYKMAA